MGARSNLIEAVFDNGNRLSSVLIHTLLERGHASPPRDLHAAESIWKLGQRVNGTGIDPIFQIPSALLDLAFRNG